MPELLRASDITVRFGGLVAVDRVSLTVQPGDVLGLIGPNGAGKTTLFDVLTGFVGLTTGAVVFDGQTVTAKPPYRRAQMGMARTFQTERPFEDLTVLENVLVPAFLEHSRRKDAERAGMQVLEKTGLADRAGQPASDLNLARRRRLELAKALVMRPKILFLDEVMAGLNPPALRGMTDFLKGLRAEGIAIVMVEHIMEAIMALSDHVIVLANGAKIAEGTPENVTRDPTVIEAYLGDSE